MRSPQPQRAKVGRERGCAPALVALQVAGAQAGSEEEGGEGEAGGEAEGGALVSYDRVVKAQHFVRMLEPVMLLPCADADMVSEQSGAEEQATPRFLPCGQPAPTAPGGDLFAVPWLRVGRLSTDLGPGAHGPAAAARRGLVQPDDARAVRRVVGVGAPGGGRGRGGGGGERQPRGAQAALAATGAQLCLPARDQRTLTVGACPHSPARRPCLCCCACCAAEPRGRAAGPAHLCAAQARGRHHALAAAGAGPRGRRGAPRAAGARRKPGPGRGHHQREPRAALELGVARRHVWLHHAGRGRRVHHRGRRRRRQRPGA